MTKNEFFNLHKSEILRIHNLHSKPDQFGHVHCDSCLFGDKFNGECYFSNQIEKERK